MKQRVKVLGVAFLTAATCAAANPTPGSWGPLVPSPHPLNYYEYICDRTPGLLSIYIVYTWNSDVTAVQFSAPKPSCFTATYISDTRLFPVTLGNSQTGVAVGFGSCRQPPVHVLTINYLVNGLTPADCVYLTLPDPSLTPPEVYMVDCNDMLRSIPSGGNVINPLGMPCEPPTPVEASTWGKIKSVFSD